MGVGVCNVLLFFLRLCACLVGHSVDSFCSVSMGCCSGAALPLVGLDLILQFNAPLSGEARTFHETPYRLEAHLLNLAD
jgi:hypothetical protein